MTAFSIIHSYASRMAIAQAQAQAQAKGNVEKPKSGGFLSWLAGYFPTLATFLGWTKQEIPKERQVGSTREVTVAVETSTTQSASKIANKEISTPAPVEYNPDQSEPIVVVDGKKLIIGKDGNYYTPEDFRKAFPDRHREKLKMKDSNYIKLFQKRVDFDREEGCIYHNNVKTNRMVRRSEKIEKTIPEETGGTIPYNGRFLNVGDSRAYLEADGEKTESHSEIWNRQRIARQEQTKASHEAWKQQQQKAAPTKEKASEERLYDYTKRDYDLADEEALEVLTKRSWFS